MILAYIISNSLKEAEEIAKELLEKKLVFSVNILDNIRSMRRDGDKITKIKRTLILPKTKALLYNEIEKEVKRLQTTGTAIVFSIPIAQLSNDLFEQIQLNILKV